MTVLSDYYGKRPQQSYFAGGSTGGREALAVAQRFPRDFSGVISVFPAFNAAALDLYFGYVSQQLAVPGAFPRPAQQVLLYNAVMQACDGLDGLRDGVIGDEAACDFDPSALLCPADSATADTCLTAVQITALRNISRPVTFPYALGSKETGYPGFPYLSGANLSTTLIGMGTSAPANPMPRTAGYGPQFWDQWVRYAVTRNPSFNSLTLDPLNPGAYQARISELTALQDVNDSNLRPFARRGGKLLMVHGTADELVSHRSTVDYYNRLVRTMGLRTVRSFARFYLVPGANHASIGAPAFAPGWDSLTALDRWVTGGAAPSNQVISDLRPGANRTRPLCEYPDYPQYEGTGDPNYASSFTCVRSEALVTAARGWRFGGR
jgi:feruloyl esterase